MELAALKARAHASYSYVSNDETLTGYAIHTIATQVRRSVVRANQLHDTHEVGAEGERGDVTGESCVGSKHGLSKVARLARAVHPLCLLA